MYRIPVDFNAMKQDGAHIWINAQVHPELQEILKPGLRVILYEDHDIQVEATIEIEEREDGTIWWWGVADWSTLKDLP